MEAVEANGVGDEAGESAIGVSLCEAIAECDRRGWCRATGGNMSALLAREPLRLLITPSGVQKGRIAPRDLLVVGSGGGRLGGGEGRPSAETLLHVALAEHAGAGAVLHTHSVAATLLSERDCALGGVTLRGYEMLKALSGIDSHEAEVVVPILPNSQDMAALAGQLAARLGRESFPQGFLLAGHGLYAWGGSVGDALRHLEALEFLLEVAAHRNLMNAARPA